MPLKAHAIFLNPFFQRRETMEDHSHEPLLILVAWFDIMATIILYVGTLCTYGVTLVNIALLSAVWYPYLCYYLTVVRFYDDYMVINRPLLPFWSKKIRYESIDYMRLTEGRGTMVKVYFRDTKNTYTFSPPLLKRNDRKMIEILEIKGVEYNN